MMNMIVSLSRGFLTFIHTYILVKVKKQFDYKGGNPVSFDLIKELDVNKVDLIHLHTSGFIASQVFKLAKKKNIPLIISLHGGFFDVTKSEHENFQSIYKGTFGYGKLLKLFYPIKDFVEYADGIICVGKKRRDHREEEISK